MKVRCPHCKVIYNIKSSTLADAGFKVVCGECHDVFEVRNGDASRKTAADSNSQGLQPGVEMQDLLADLQHSLDKQDTKQSTQETIDSFLPPVPPDSLFAEKPGQGEFLTDQPEAKEEEFLAEFSRQNKPVSPLAIASLLVLLLTALAQLAWIEKERLLQFPRVHTAASHLCSYFGCTLPQTRTKEEESFLVVDRSLQAYSRQPGAYQLDVLLRNAASSTKTLPALQLSLLDDKQAAIARRTFPPGDYMTGHKQPRQLAAGELLEIQLLLLPPEEHFSGYRLDFIPTDSS